MRRELKAPKADALREAARAYEARAACHKKLDRLAEAVSDLERAVGLEKEARQEPGGGAKPEKP